MGSRPRTLMDTTTNWAGSTSISAIGIRIAYDFRHNYRLQHKDLYFNNLATGSLLTRENWGTSLDDIYTLSPSLILDVRGSWTRFHESNASPSDGIDPTTYGFPSYLAANSQFIGLPYLHFNSGCSANAVAFQCVGMTGDTYTPYDFFQIFASIVKITGNHTIKIGADLRDYRESASARGYSDRRIVQVAQLGYGAEEHCNLAAVRQGHGVLPAGTSLCCWSYDPEDAKHGEVPIITIVLCSRRLARPEVT